VREHNTEGEERERVSVFLLPPPQRERERERERERGQLRSRTGASEAGSGSSSPSFRYQLINSSYHTAIIIIIIPVPLLFLSYASPLIHSRKKKTKKGPCCIGCRYGYESARLVFDFGSSPFGCPSGGRFLPLLIRLISICSCRWRLLLGFPCLVLDLRQEGFAVHSGSARRAVLNPPSLFP